MAIATSQLHRHINGESHLVTQTRLSLMLSIGLLIFSVAFLMRTTKSIINFGMPNVDAFLGPLIIAGLFILLTKYEIEITDKIIKKVIKNEKVKSTITT